jgi:hypothetical protein
MFLTEQIGNFFENSKDYLTVKAQQQTEQLQVRTAFLRYGMQAMLREQTEELRVGM